MFEDIEAKLGELGDVQLKALMHKSILHIVRIIQPASVTSIAIDTRIILADTQTELKEWVNNHRERFLHQRQMFSDFLSRIQSLQIKINHISAQ
jgi:hypothetical protein